MLTAILRLVGPMGHHRDQLRQVVAVARRLAIPRRHRPGQSHQVAAPDRSSTNIGLRSTSGIAGNRIFGRLDHLAEEFIAKPAICES